MGDDDFQGRIVFGVLTRLVGFKPVDRDRPDSGRLVAMSRQLRGYSVVLSTPAAHRLPSALT